MNLLDAEDMIKGLPDQALMQQAQMPTGEIPQFLVISEIKNRADMRKRYEAQLKEQPQGTVAEQVMREGIAGMMPQQGVTPQMGQQPPQGGPQMPQQGMPPQGGPQGMPPQGMPPQGMPPQMPPQGGPQGMPPQMPPQGMPPQGMPPGMPPMGMAAGGIVRMRNGGILDQYVAGAEAGPMPGGSTVRDQIDRVLGSGMSYPEILSFVSKTFYGQPEVLEYVQSKVGRPEPTMGSGGMGERSPSVDTDALISGMVSKRVGDRPRMGDVTASDIYGGSFALGEIDLGMPTREQVAAADGAVVERIRSQLSPSISGGDIDEAVAGMVSERAPRSGGIPSLSTAPQRGAGGRPFDFNIDLGMPTREQVIMADRAAVAGIRSKLSPSLGSIDASDIDRSIAGMVSERAPRSGGIPDLFGTGFGGAEYSSPKPGVESADPISEMLALAQSVQTDASDPRRESKSLAGAGILSGSTPSEIAAQLYDYSRPTSGARGRPVEGSPSRKELIYGTLGEDYSGFMPPVLAGPAARQKFIDEVVASGRLDDRFATDLFGTGFGGADYSQAPSSTVQEINERLGIGPAGPVTNPPDDITVQGNKNNSQKQGTGTGPAGDTDATLSLIDEMMADLRGRETQASPTLDLSDILARSKKMTDANILMQLGSGIAGGDVAKGIEKAGMAGVQGAQEAAKIEMAQRISQTKAGQEDIRRGEQRDLDVAKLEIARERIKSELDRSDGLNQRAVLGYYRDMGTELRKKATTLAGTTGEELSPEEKAYLTAIDELMDNYSAQYGIALPEIELPEDPLSLGTPPPPAGA